MGCVRGRQCVCVGGVARRRRRRPAVLQVAHQRHRGARHAAQLAVDRAKVEQRLRGVLPHAIARIEEGHGARRGGLRGGALCGVAQHHHLRVARQRAHAVAQRLALCRGGGGLRHLQHAAAQALHSRGKGAGGARGGLVKHVGQHAVLQQLAAAPRAHNPRHRLGNLAQVVHHARILKLGNRYHVVVGEVRGGGDGPRIGGGHFGPFSTLDAHHRAHAGRRRRPRLRSDGGDPWRRRPPSLPASQGESEPVCDSEGDSEGEAGRAARPARRRPTHILR
jgi:hypothetical protein